MTNVQVETPWEKKLEISSGKVSSSYVLGELEHVGGASDLSEGRRGGVRPRGGEIDLGGDRRLARSPEDRQDSERVGGVFDRFERDNNFLIR